MLVVLCFVTELARQNSEPILNVNRLKSITWNSLPRTLVESHQVTLFKSRFQDCPVCCSAASTAHIRRTTVVHASDADGPDADTQHRRHVPRLVSRYKARHADERTPRRPYHSLAARHVSSLD